MMITTLAQIIGVIAIFLLFCVKFYIAVNEKAFHKAGRTAILWTSIYVFFLFALRLLQVLHIGTIDQLRIISGFTTPIPLIATIIQLFFTRTMDDEIV